MDGYRLQVVKDGPTVRLYSRGGLDWSKRLTPLAKALAGIPCQSAVIDAELVFPGADGAPNFIGLQAALSDQQHELAIFAFDLMLRDGRDLRPLPLIERRRHLERLLARSEVACLHLVQAFDDGVKLLEAAERYGLEGIVSKRRSAPYRSDECRDWRKIKTTTWREANRERWRMFERS